MTSTPTHITGLRAPAMFAFRDPDGNAFSSTETA